MYQNPVFYAVSTLRNNGFLHVDDQHFLLLTKAGRTIAENTFEKHKFFSAILIEAGVEPKTAEKEACRIEHTISTESLGLSSFFASLRRRCMKESHLL